MKRWLLLLILFAVPAFPSETYVTTVQSTGASAVTGIIPWGKVMIWCDAAAYIAWGPSTVTVSSVTGFPVAASEKWDSSSTPESKYLAVISVSGTVNCYIFKVR